jgi:hypothetical protein
MMQDEGSEVVVVDQKPIESVDPTEVTRTETDAPEPPTEANETTHNAIPDADTLKDVDLSSEAGDTPQKLPEENSEGKVTYADLLLRERKTTAQQRTVNKKAA